MRRTSSALLLSVLVPGLLLVPVVTPASAAPVPVAPGVVELPVSGVDAGAAAEPTPERSALRRPGSARRTVLLTTRRATADYGMVGVTWDGGTPVGVVEAEVRTRASGAWSDWTSLGGAADEEPDAREAASSRAGTAPLWVGDADGVQVRVDVLSGAAPTGLRVALVDPGESAADAAAASPRTPRAAAHAAASAPAIRTRAQWGADESLRTGTPSYASSLKAVVMHHTASTNSYAASDVPSLLRGFYAYHVKSRGWSDIGYNVLVDRFGTAWEGRAGGLSQAVIGAHAGGFNTGTVGVSMIGTYETVTPSPAMLATVAQLVAWKTSTAGVDPRGTVRLTSGGSTRFAAGTTVTLPTVMGHGQVSTTSCPGAKGYAALPALRERAAAITASSPVTAPPPAPAPAPVPAPVPSPNVAATGLELVAASSAAAGSTAQLLVRGGAGSAAVEVFFSRRGEVGAVVRRTATLAPDGTYRTSYVVNDDYTVFAVSGGTATPRTTLRQVPAPTTAAPVVAPGVGVEGPVTAVSGSSVLLTARGPAGADVSVWLRRTDSPRFVRARAGRFDATGRFTTTYVADGAYEWFARTATAASAEGRTALGPVPNGLDVTAPEAAPTGATVPVAVQGTPGSVVQLWFAAAGAGFFTRRRQGVLGPDGMYRTTYLATADQTFFATTAGRSSARRTTRTGALTAATASTVSALRLTAPRSVAAGAVVPVAVAGTPGASVELWTRRLGAAVWVRSRVGRLGADGRWTTSYVGSQDHDLWAASGPVTSGDVSVLVAPVLSAPTSAPLGARVDLTGRARPSDAVVVESRRRSTGAVVRRAVTADGNGAFATWYTANDEYEHRVSATDRLGQARRTTISPTATAPTSAVRGTSFPVSGTARPGARVEVLYRPAGTWVFSLGRTVTADSAGRWATTLKLSSSALLLARADGTTSPARTVTTR